MALPAIIAPAIGLVNTIAKMAWTWVSGTLFRQKSALEAARDAREIDSEVGRMPNASVRDELRKRAKDRDK